MRTWGHRQGAPKGGEVMRRIKQTVRAIWEEIPSLESLEERKELTRWAAQSESEPRLRAALALAESEQRIVVAAELLDADPYLLNVENGTIDLRSGEVTSIVWATGFSCDFGWIDQLLLDARGYPIQHHGVTPQPGLYFCGLHWMHCLKSGLFFGVGEAARRVTGHLLSKDGGAASAAA